MMGVTPNIASLSQDGGPNKIKGLNQIPERRVTDIEEAKEIWGARDVSWCNTQRE
jgi:hypothetical protein